MSPRECSPVIIDKGNETKIKSQLYFFLHSNGGKQAKKGIIRGKRKLDKGKNDPSKEMTATRQEQMAIKDKFSFKLSFSLKIITKVYNELNR